MLVSTCDLCGRLVLGIWLSIICTYFLLCTEGKLFTSFEQGSCIKENDTVTITCVLEDNVGVRGTEWSGSSSIFICPNVLNTISDDMIYLSHYSVDGQPVCSVGECGDNVNAKLHDVNNTLSLYTSTLTIHQTTLDMDEGIVSCFLGYPGFSDQFDHQKLLVEAIPASPSLTNVTWQISTNSAEKKFTIYWESAAKNTKRGISHYSIQSSDIFTCGQCNIGDVSNATNELSCIGWEPAHELHKVCNLTIIPIGAFCGFSASSPLVVTVHLNYPQPPIIMYLVPIYKVCGELRAIRIILQLNNQGSFQDENGRNITYFLRVRKSDEVCTQIKTHQNECDMSGQCKLEFDDSALKYCLDNVVMSYKIEALAVSIIGESMINVHPHEIERQNPYVEGIDLIYNQRNAEFLITSTEKCNVLNSIDVRYGTTCNCPFADESLLVDNNTTSCINISSVFVSYPQCACFTVILTINDKDQPLGIQLHNNAGVGFYKVPYKLLLTLFMFMYHYNNIFAC